MLHHLIVNSKLIRPYTMVLKLFWEKVPSGDLKLLLNKVACNLYQLHPVAECRADRREHVCRGNKEYLRQVILHLEEIVKEGAVLLGIKNFKKCR